MAIMDAWLEQDGLVAQVSPTGSTHLMKCFELQKQDSNRTCRLPRMSEKFVAAENKLTATYASV